MADDPNPPTPPESAKTVSAGRKTPELLSLQTKLSELEDRLDGHDATLGEWTEFFKPLKAGKGKGAAPASKSKDLLGLDDLAEELGLD